MPTRVETDTPEGDALGFFGDLFSGWIEVYDDSRLYLYYIISRNKNEGNTQHLLRYWESLGYDVRVVKPGPIMQHILAKLNFSAAFEYLPNQYEDPVEVWRKEIPQYHHHYSSRPATRVGSS